MKRSADPNSDKMRAEFRQKLENYQAAPSENLWDKIELSLDKEEAQVYKNRFRIYSRLAAACLLLLLAFGAVFIPNKFKRLQQESTELAQKQNTETNPNTDSQSPESKVQVAENSAGKITSKAKTEQQNPTENAIISEEKTATAPGLETKEQIAFHQAPARRENNAQITSPENNTLEKTVAFNASKVRTQNQVKSTSESVSEHAENATIAAAKTTSPETSFTDQPEGMALNETIAAVSAPELAENSPVAALAPEVENSGKTSAVALAIAGKETSPENNEAKADAVPGNPKAQIAAATNPKTTANQTPAIAKTGTFSGQNPTVSEAQPTRKGLSLLSGKTTRLAKTAPVALPDTNVLAAIPQAQVNSETEKPVVAALKTNKWLVALAYSGRSFVPGMQLASQAQIKPSSISNTQEQMQNLAQYEAAIQEFNQETRSVLSHGGAVQISYKFAGNWQLQTGITYFDHRAQTTSHYAFADPGYGNTGIAPNYPQPQTYQPALQSVLAGSFDPARSEVMQAQASQTMYSFQQVGVPVNLRYQSVSPTLYYFAAAGFSMNLLTSTTITYQQKQVTYQPASTSAKYLSVSGNPLNVFETWLPAVGLQAGVGYHLSEHWQTELALEGDQYLKPLIRAENLAGTKQKNPVSVGASVKLGYSF